MKSLIKNNLMLSVTIGILLILLGLIIILLYEKYSAKRGLTFKLRNAGIFFIMIGIALILDGLNII